jgi:hypothetical protein
MVKSQKSRLDQFSQPATRKKPKLPQGNRPH